jgi:methyltransferase (TIGR00027 family)
MNGTSRHIYVPVDFENEDLEDRLAAAGFDWTRPAMFTCVGTTMYLHTKSVEEVLGIIGRSCEGSEVVLSYNQPIEYIDAAGREFLRVIAPGAGRSGEPIQNAYSPEAMEELIRVCGLRVIEHPTSDELARRYCAGRLDGLRPYTVERLIAAARVLI